VCKNYFLDLREWAPWTESINLAADWQAEMIEGVQKK